MANNSDVIQQDVYTVFEGNYATYGASVLLGRAIPTIEDGWNPCNRRILYTMHHENITNFKKAIYYVGQTLALAHPHGDLSLYESLVYLSQWHKNQIPFVDAQGNNGSLTRSDSYAAPRYLELKLSKFSKEIFFDGIDSGIVDFEDNYDKSAKLPVVLASKFPTILNNGISGIGAAYASDIPVHSIRDICKATLAKIDNPDLDSKGIAKILCGPDFPTGGEIINTAELPAMYESGQGVIRVRGVMEIRTKGNKEYLVITQVPPRCDIGKLVEEITSLCKEKEEGKKKVPGLLQDKIADIVDGSSKRDIEVIIYPKKDVSCAVLKSLIFEHTNMQYSHKYMMNVLHNGKFLANASLDYVVQGWIDFRTLCVTRKYNAIISKDLERMTIVKALIKAHTNIDAIIKLIKSSSDKQNSKEVLISKYDFAEKEAEYIVNMQLYKLASLEIDKLKIELKELEGNIAFILKLIQSKDGIANVIRGELEELIATYGKQPRKTKLLNLASKVDMTELVEDEDLLINITTDNYIYAKPVSELKESNRGNKGSLLIDSKRNKIIDKSFIFNSRDRLFCFSDDGKLFVLYAYQLNVNNTHINNIISGLNNRRIVSFIPIKDTDEGHLIFVTSSSFVKRCDLAEYRTRMPATGLLAMKLDNGEILIDTLLSKSEQDELLLITTSRGNASKMPVENLIVVNRTTKGKRKIRMKEGEECVSAVLTDLATEDSTHVLLITTKGKGKMVNISELLYKKTEAGMSAAFQAIKLNPEDKLCRSVVIHKNEEVVINSKSGKSIKINSEQVNTYGRAAKGGIIMRLNDDDTVAGITVV